MNEISLVLPDLLWHPSSVAARAHLFGVPSVNVENASVLEQDCADGGNLLSIAASLPDATCRGITASIEALERGRNLIAESELNNVTLNQAGDDIEGTFDYIFLRNTFSSTVPDQRSNLISFYANKLTENGILVVEQLSLPGWSFLKPIRDQVRYHTRNIEDPHEKMVAGRQFLNALSQSVPANMEQYRLIAQTAWETSNRIPDLNFGFEYFDDQRFPSHFHEFAEAIDGSGLQYLCELSLGSLFINRFPAAMASIMPENASVTESEQYLDFTTNRNRRISLLCRDQFEVKRQIDSSVSRDLYFSAEGAPDRSEDVNREEAIVLQSPYGGVVTMENEAAKAAILALTSRYPRRLSVPELLDIVKETLSEYTEADEEAVLEAITACAVSELAQIDSIPGRACLELSDRPIASPLVRAQARLKEGSYVSSLQHRCITIDQPTALLLEMLDGSNGKAELVERVIAMFSDELLVLKKDGEPVTEPEAISEASENQVDAFLSMFARSGLLEA